jgi:uncharacterized protein (TIGR03435 family)
VPAEVGSTPASGRLMATNNTLKDLIVFAYSIKDFQILSNTDWITSERYEVAATAGKPASKDELRLMAQTLLSDRFKLTIHRDRRELSTYALTIAKARSKLVEANEGADDIRFGIGRITAKHVSASTLIDVVLSPLLARPIQDQTRLSAHYDFALQWTPSVGEGTVNPFWNNRPRRLRCSSTDGSVRAFVICCIRGATWIEVGIH